MIDKFVIGLDRDGTINKDIGNHVKHPKWFEPFYSSLKTYNKGYDVVILTTQNTQRFNDPRRSRNSTHATTLGNIGCTSINGLYYSTTNLKEDIRVPILA